MRFRRPKSEITDARTPIYVEPNGIYFGDTIFMFLLLAFLAYIPLRIFGLPGWIAWPVASLHLFDELRRSRNHHIKLASRWNNLLEDWLVHERRAHNQRMKRARRKQSDEDPA